MTDKQNNLKKAVLWEPAGKEKKVNCKLCNFRCLIDDGKVGRCLVRKNIDGTLYSMTYNKVISANPDPIEKKPLYHFQPGTSSFSIATMGCNFRCKFCQNWQISQAAIETGSIDGQAVTPQQIVDAALRNKCSSIAHTYTEPTIFMELSNDCGRLAKEKGLTNVFVTNGYMTKEAIDFASDWLNGMNIDLKAFNENYYRNLCSAHLQPVLDTIKYVANHTDIWLELTTLLVPGQNDSEEEIKKLTDFIVTQAGPDIPWHISRFHPQYKYTDSTATPMQTMEKAYHIGKKAGLHYVYLGNVVGPDTANTYCYNCGRVLIKRTGFSMSQNYLKNAACPHCGTKVAGYGL